MTTDLLTLKTSLSPITTINLSSSDQVAVGEYLQKLRRESPDLITGLPCVLDAEFANNNVETLRNMVAVIRSAGISLVGLKNIPTDFYGDFRSLQLADFGNGKPSRVKHSADEPATNELPDTEVKEVQIPTQGAQSPPGYPTRVIHDNVRSGQNLDFDGNIIIQGMVSAGAEVLATGSIQIFGALRGKAIAGIDGDTQVSISCSRFHAELVSIASRYRLFDEPECEGKAVVVLLENNELILHESN